MTENQARTVKCPYCKKDSVFGPENPYRPFCSERCRLIDLGAWADENYKVPTTNTDQHDEDKIENNDDESDLDS